MLLVLIGIFPYQVTGQSDAQSRAKINKAGTYIAEVNVGEIRVLETNTFTTIQTFNISGATISWHPLQEEILAFISDDFPLTIANVVTGETILEIQDHNDGSSVSFSPDGTMLATSHGDVGIPTGRGIIQIWDSQNGNLLRVTTEINPGLSNVSWSPDGSLVAAFQPDRRRLVIFDMANGQPTGAVGNSEFFVSEFYSWNPGGNTIAVRDAGSLTLWNTQTYERILTTPYIGPIADVEYSPDGQLIGVLVREGTLILDAGTAEVVAQLPTARSSVIWLPDSSGVIVEGADGYQQIAIE